MSNLLSANRIDTVRVNVVFNNQSSATIATPANFNFTPRVVQCYISADCTTPATSTLINFEINGVIIGSCFSNSGVASFSNPVIYKDKQYNFSSGNLSAYLPSGASVALSGSVVCYFIIMD